MTLKNKLLASTPAVAAEGWDLSTAVLAERYYNSTDAYGLTFKPDGTRMYTTSFTNIYEWNLSVPWDVRTITFSNGFSYAAGSGGNLFGSYFSPDGTLFFTVRRGSGFAQLIGFGLGTAWDIATASAGLYGASSFDVYSLDTSPQSIFLKSDGTKMYFAGSGTSSIYEYNLSTPWNLSTQSLVNTLNIAAREVVPTSIFFSDDGSKMYVSGTSSDAVNMFTLSTPWDISTAVYVTQFSLLVEDLTIRNIFFKPDGSRMFYSGVTNDTVAVLNLTTSWDIATASFSSKFFRVASQDAAPSDLYFKPDGTTIFMIGSGSDRVNEYSLSTPWNITTASFVQFFSVATQETTPLGLFFKPDGTTMYVIGSVGDDINEYSLSTPWDISTASYIRVYYIGANEATPNSLYFSPDGNYFYFIGTTGDDVNQYTMSTPWTLTTATFTRAFVTSGKEANGTSLYFKPDGTKMYIAGITSDSIHQYDLSTAWDISTAVFSKSLNILNYEINVNGITFRYDNGKSLYLVGSGSDTIYQIDL